MSSGARSGPGSLSSCGGGGLIGSSTKEETVSDIVSTSSHGLLLQSVFGIFAASNKRIFPVCHFSHTIPFWKCPQHCIRQRSVPTGLGGSLMHSDPWGCPPYPMIRIIIATGGSLLYNTVYLTLALLLPFTTLVGISHTRLSIP